MPLSGPTNKLHALKMSCGNYLCRLISCMQKTAQHDTNDISAILKILQEEGAAAKNFAGVIFDIQKLEGKWFIGVKADFPPTLQEEINHKLNANPAKPNFSEEDVRQILFEIALDRLKSQSSASLVEQYQNLMVIHIYLNRCLEYAKRGDETDLLNQMQELSDFVEKHKSSLKELTLSSQKLSLFAQPKSFLSEIEKLDLMLRNTLTIHHRTP